MRSASCSRGVLGAVSALGRHGSREEYILAYRLYLALVYLQAAGATTVSAHERAPGHAAPTDRAVDAGIGYRVSSFEPFFHLRSPSVQ